MPLIAHADHAGMSLLMLGILGAVVVAVLIAVLVAIFGRSDRD